MSELVVGSLKGLSANNFEIAVASGSKIVQSGGILQILQTVKTDTFTTSSTSPTSVTGLSVNITPRSASSKILVIADVALGFNNTGGDQTGFMRIRRNSTAIYVGDAAGSRTQAAGVAQINATGFTWATYFNPRTMTFLDSPATTSQITYDVQIWMNAGDSVQVNRYGNDADAARMARFASSITAIEVVG